MRAPQVLIPEGKAKIEALIVPIWFEFRGVSLQGTRFLLPEPNSSQVKEFKHLKSCMRQVLRLGWPAYCSESGCRRVRGIYIWQSEKPRGLESAALSVAVVAQVPRCSIAAVLAASRTGAASGMASRSQEVCRGARLGFGDENRRSRARPCSQDMDVRAWRARVLTWSGQLAEAEKEYLEILKFTRNDPDNWMGLASVYVRQGRLEDALRSLDRAVEIDPKRADLRADSSAGASGHGGTKRSSRGISKRAEPGPHQFGSARRDDFPPRRAKTRAALWPGQ